MLDVEVLHWGEDLIYCGRKGPGIQGLASKSRLRSRSMLPPNTGQMLSKDDLPQRFGSDYGVDENKIWELYEEMEQETQRPGIPILPVLASPADPGPSLLACRRRWKKSWK